jgi:hypothetical protein
MSILTYSLVVLLGVLIVVEPAPSCESRSNVGMADNELKHGGVGVVGCMLATKLELAGDNHELNMLITCDVEDVLM